MSEFASRRAPHTPARGLLTWAAAGALIAHTALAQADQLELDALVQEGALIQEEAAGLGPATELLAQEELEIVSSDKALREEVRTLNQEITQFNVAKAEYTRSAEEVKVQCKGQPEDQALVDSCNARITRLRDQANELEEQRPQLRARQEEITARVEKHNAWTRDYVKRKQEQDTRGKLNQQDAEDWLARARQLLASGEFAAWLTKAGSPAACDAEQMKEIAALSLYPALDRAEACLKAVKARSR